MNNTAGGFGGGIASNEYCPTVLTHCTVSGNAASVGGGLAHDFFSQLAILMGLVVLQRPREVFPRGALATALGMAVAGAPAFFFPGGNVAFLKWSLLRDTPEGSSAPLFDKLRQFVSGGAAKILEFGGPGETLGLVLGLVWVGAVVVACVLAVTDDRKRMLNIARSLWRRGVDV